MKLNFHNVAISGTGTRVGVFRLEEHVIKYQPDIIFIEFAVNDSTIAIKDEQLVISDLDCIVRRLIRFNPDIKIIFLYTAKKDWQACSEVHEKVAKQYHIPSIDLQKYIKSKLEALEYKWEELFADHVHPSVGGHRIYAEYIINELEKDWNKYFSCEHRLNDSIAKYKYAFPRICGFDDLKLMGFEKNDVIDRYKHIEEMNVKKLWCQTKPAVLLQLIFMGIILDFIIMLDGMQVFVLLKLMMNRKPGMIFIITQRVNTFPYLTDMI